MWKNINLERCLDHINSSADAELASPPEARPAITVSRMCGSGGRTVASKLAEYLDPHAPYGIHWTIFDQGLIKKVLEDHRLPVRLAGLLPERSQSFLREMMEKLRGKNPSASKIVEQTVETIWRLAQGGYVILVGRGANVVTARLRNVFHVRLVGSLQNRLERLEEVYDFDRRTAMDFLKSQDSAKKLYLKAYFGEEIENPELYHLIVNTDRIAYGDAARLIGDAVIHWFKMAPTAKT
ncbi:MAG TPA: cytidylate kinase-like family protein [Candidatus Acidoferrales bacterium]|nr:cytidylate kinase-like family protein [Candidatus Acidoferrales bacterium]